MTSQRLTKLLRTASRLVGTPRLSAALRSGVRVAVYHHIGDETDFTRHLGVGTPIDTFEAHMDRLSRDYDVIEASDLESRHLPRRPLLVTFDDAYRSVLDTAMPIMRDRGIRPVCFLTTSPIFDGGISIDNLLSWCMSNRPDVPRREFGDGACAGVGWILRAILSGYSSSERSAVRDRLCRLVGWSPWEMALSSGLYLEKSDLRRLVELGADVAGHTHTHVHLRSLGREELEREIDVPKRLLEGVLGSTTGAFSVPFGDALDLTNEAREVLESHGIGHAFLVEGGCNTGSSKFVLDRSSVGALHAADLGAEFEVLSVVRRCLARGFA